MKSSHKRLHHRVYPNEAILEMATTHRTTPHSWVASAAKLENRWLTIVKITILSRSLAN